MGYKKHAEKEFVAAGWVDAKGEWKCDMQKEICGQVVELLGLFSQHGHSGSTAPYAINLFTKLAKFEPIVPLTGHDFEWVEVGDSTWQNSRCGHVFKEKDGRAYDIEGKVFRGKDGCCYTNIDSRVYIDFPYTPKTEYVDV